ncbi:serine/threonine-protein kinase TNNI3K [Pelomyxa schiedti]|nr:serine/threonine-protein kinase TNNI3K [Pelomyxa schiedti]
MDSEEDSRKRVVEACEEGDVDTVRSWLFAHTATTSGKPHRLLHRRNSTHVTGGSCLDAVNVPLNEEGETALHIACGGDNLSLVKYLMGEGADVNLRPEGSVSAVQKASSLGHHRVVRALISAPSISLCDCEYSLVMACQMGHDKVVSALMSHPRIDVRAIRTSTGTSILHVACASGREQIVALLLASAALDVNMVEPDKGWTPLYAACSGGYLQVASLLLRNPDVDANKATKEGRTPLCTACLHGQEQIVRVLLESPNILVNQPLENPPLHLACYNGHDFVVHLLLNSPKVGLDINLRNSEGKSALFIACQLSRKFIVEILLQSPDIDVDQAIPNSGETPLVIALYNNDFEIARCLIKEGAVVPDSWVSRLKVHLGLAKQQRYAELCESVIPEIKNQITFLNNRVEAISLQASKARTFLVVDESDLKVLSKIGDGSYGSVSKCVFLPTGTPVAVKKMHEEIRSQHNNQQFLREAEIVAMMKHPNIVQCLGVCGPRDATLKIVSELMCCSLRQLLSHRKLNPHEVIAISIGIAKGMAAAHKQNVMHRDLSSNNVLFDAAGTPKICDFGVSKYGVDTQLENTIGPGTALYLPPQMHTNDYSLKGDVWEFGILMSEMLLQEIPQAETNTPNRRKSSLLLQELKINLNSTAMEEVDRLLSLQMTAVALAECLGRREKCLAGIGGLPSPPLSPPALLHILATVTSCLSLPESERPGFETLDVLLAGCAQLLFSQASPICTPLLIQSCLQRLLSGMTGTGF